MKRYICLILALLIVFPIVGCNANTPKNGIKLGEDIVKNENVTKEADDEFINAYNSFALEFFKTAAEEGDSKNNILISPLSVLTALAMTANGADGDTLSEMEKVLAGGMEIEKLNAYIGHLAENLGENLKIANSIWMKNESGVEVREEFLQTNADYYGAEIFKAAFDDATVSDINTWVDDNTDGMIKKLLEKIDASTFMYLINALAFEDTWEEKYKEHSIYNGAFRAYDGSKREVEYMASEENKYIEGSGVTGFIKPYESGKYSFAVLLPDEGISVFDYIRTLDGKTLSELLNNVKNESVDTVMPKFTLDFDIKLNDTLEKMGMPKAFSKSQADFSKMASSAVGNIYIGNVLHKTFMAVDEAGTKAGAVTAVDMCAEGFIEKKNIVVLDRPFICMIIDTENSLPIFMGTVGNIGKEIVDGDEFVTNSFEQSNEQETVISICNDHETNNEVQYTHEFENVYCGNTVTKIIKGDWEVEFVGDYSVLVTDILRTLNYADPTCRCMSEYKIITEFGTFEVNLTQSFARCENGQAPLNSYEKNAILEAIRSKAEK